jgi:predicted ATPase/DNA-binding CsgD family transcriptional regulator
MTRKAVRRATAGHLPAGLSSFVGRRDEVAETKNAIAEFRLVTLTGTAGVGKTRLALQVASAMRRAFADGVWFVDLAQLHEPELLEQTVAVTLGLQERSALAPLEMLVEHLADRRLLLLLDNCEHLVDACAKMAEHVLRRAPGVRILATSREPLHVTGEKTFRVPPLSVTDDAVALEGELVPEAVALFYARARDLAPRLTTTAQRKQVVQICQRLDGLPLAIELAAALLRVVSPQEVLDRLTDRYRLLTQGRRSAPYRQQTLRAAIDWSFDLCAGPEQRLWTRLSVFSGEFELDAAERVCSGDGVEADDVLPLVVSLVERSVLTPVQVGDVARYRLLETLREYGHDKLRTSGDYLAWRRRHRDWYAGLVTRADAEWNTDRQPRHYALLGREHANLQLALDFSLAEPGEAEVALRMLTGLWRFFWWGRGWVGEGRHWLGRALELASEPAADRARALLVDSTLAVAQGDFTAGRARLEEGSAIAESVGEPETLAFARWVAGSAEMFAGHLPASMRLLEQGRDIVATVPGSNYRLDILLLLGVGSGLMGDQERAEQYNRETLALTDGTGECFHRAYALWALALIQLDRGDHEGAAELTRQSLRLRLGHDDRMGTFWSVETLAWVHGASGEHDRAATLLGAAAALQRSMGITFAGYQHLVHYHEACHSRSCEALGEAGFDAAFRRGARLVDIVAFALGEGPDESAEAAASPAATGVRLTRREMEVAHLVAEGLTNRDIAERLVISPRTAETHVANVMKKLGFSSRGQLSPWLLRERQAEGGGRHV